MSITRTILPPITDRDEWLAWRRTGIGASDVAGILGLSPWDTPWSVWADKVGLTDPDDTEVTDAMRHGTWAERTIGPWFEERTGLAVRQPQARAVGSEPWMLATLDGLAFEEPSGVVPVALVEMKATGESAKTWAEAISMQYQCQGVWQSIVTGIDHVMFAVLHVTFGRLQFEVYEFTPSDDDKQFVLDAVRAFWYDHVLAGVMPAADGRTPTTQAIKAAWGDIEDADDVMLADERLIELHADLVNTKATVKQLGEHQAALENEIKARMQDCAVLAHDGQPLVTWKPIVSNRLDGTALREAHPDIAREFTRSTTARTFLVKQPKEK